MVILLLYINDGFIKIESMPQAASYN